MWSLLFCLQTTFNTSHAMIGNDVFMWTSGSQAMIWYYWGKHWKFQWGDMSDERRIPALVGTLITTSFLYAGLAVFIRESDEQQSAITTAITATMAYFLMGLSFQYLHMVTNHNLHEEIDDNMPLSSSIPIKKVAVIADETNHDIEQFRVFEEMVDTSRPSTDGHTGLTGHTHTVYSLTSPTISTTVSSTSNSSPTTTTEMSPSSLENGHIQSDSDLLQMKPTNNNNNNNNNNNILTTSTKSLSSSLPFLTSQKGRHPSSENLMMHYETSHILSDKIVVVFVQVVTSPNHHLPFPPIWVILWKGGSV